MKLVYATTATERITKAKNFKYVLRMCAYVFLILKTSKEGKKNSGEPTSAISTKLIPTPHYQGLLVPCITHGLDHALLLPSACVYPVTSNNSIASSALVAFILNSSCI